MTSETERPALRRYQGMFADSSRWERFAMRPDDIVITTPSKCGTTWMQTIVGSLVFGRVDLGAPMSTISPWLDMMIHSDDEVFKLLDAHGDRRFIKTHTHLDGLPILSAVTYIAVVRHPLDVALSDRDHGENMRIERAMEMRAAVSGESGPGPARPDPPDDLGDYLRWFIDNDLQPTGSGPEGLDDYCQQITTYWQARDLPNVHLFHYADMWNDLEGQMRRVAGALGVQIAEDVWPVLVDGATLASMRGRAEKTIPNAHQDLWYSPQQFFKSGGTRSWAAHLSSSDIAHFEARIHALAGDAAPWALQGGRGRVQG
jgi:hypothetical protein